ncbi:amidohydrolase family protein [Flagellimonas sp. HMM57]|uniref:amidohydrolase family protein n=1 Tax=unclassified Flagellimonas TaxID=2644544 RepID=UPI0013CFB6F8|nr:MULTISPECIES: amidohydrolase family protein [unclassified Flagellimonas]UII77386.1 amidohydrolase family protein [Flagellimonas sp. HMM57]
MRYLVSLVLIVSTTMQSQTVSLEGVNIVDVISGTIIKNQNIQLNNDIIQQIGPRPFRKSDKRIKLKGKYVIPGLWDMHVHLTNVGKESLPLFITNGIIGVRDMGGNWKDIKKWKEQKHSYWPTIFSPGPILESKPFYQLVKQLMGPDFAKTRIPVPSPERAFEIIDSLNTEGVDFIKVRSAKDMPTLSAIVQFAKKKNLNVAGHIEANLRMMDALNIHLYSVEHTTFFQLLGAEDSIKESIIESFKSKSPYFTPTLIATENSRLNSTAFKDLTAIEKQQLSPELKENWEVFDAIKMLEAPMKWDSINAIFNEFSKRIVNPETLLAGTDLGVPGVLTGSSLHKELELLVNRLDVTNLTALKSATINASKTLGLQSEYGSIEENKKASLLVLDKNPLENIANTRTIYMVIHNGIIIDKEKGIELTADVENELNLSRKNYPNSILDHLKESIKRMKGNK